MQRHSRIARTTIWFAAAAIGGLCAHAAAQTTACSLATPDELRAALGANVTGLTSSGTLGNASICSGQTPTASILVRLATRSGGPGAETAGLEAVKKVGAQVEVKTDGPITCSTMIPPQSLAQYGFNTTCSVLKNGRVAAIEVTAKTQQSMVPMETLRRVAEKMAGRF